MWGDPYKGQLGHYENNQTWTHEEKNLYGSPILIKFENEVQKVVNGGIHSTLLTTDGQIYTFGCGSDGRLGHPEYEGHTYLYKESKPKLIEFFKGQKVLDVQSSYYHMMALVEK